MDTGADVRDPAAVAAVVEKIGIISRTALLVAHDRALESARADGFFRDPWAAILAGKVGAELSAAMSAHPFACNLDAEGKPGGWPEYHQQWTAVRTKFIDDALAAERAAGVAQVVCLGAGVDMRAFRLDALRGCRLIEVETPEMHEARRVLVDSLGLEAVCERKAVCCDVTQTEELARKLESEGGWDPAKPTVWLLEGLLMYMSKAAQEDLLSLLGRSSAPGSCAIINFLYAPAHGQFGKDESTAFLRSAGFDGAVDAHSFGDAVLSYGRYREGLPADEAFSFAVARTQPVEAKS